MSEVFFLLYEILYLFMFFIMMQIPIQLEDSFNIYFLKNIGIKESIHNKMRARQILDAQMWQHLC